MSSISAASGHAAHAMTHAPRPPKSADRDGDQAATAAAPKPPASATSSKNGVNVLA
jgi:hypothetical protein